MDKPGTRSRLQGTIRATDIKTEFYSGEADVPLSRYLRPPSGVLVPNLPVNQKVKNVPQNVAYSNYYGALFWFLSITYISSTSENTSTYSTNNDGKMKLSIRGVSAEYTIKYKGEEFRIKNDAIFELTKIDGDKNGTFTITDNLTAPDGTTVLPANISPPSWEIAMFTGVGQDSSAAGLFYSTGLQQGSYLRTSGTNSSLYLPWTVLTEEDKLRLVSLDVLNGKESFIIGNNLFNNLNYSYTISIKKEVTSVYLKVQPASPQAVINFYLVTNDSPVPSTALNKSKLLATLDKFDVRAPVPTTVLRGFARVTVMRAPDIAVTDPLVTFTKTTNNLTLLNDNKLTTTTTNYLWIEIYNKGTSQKELDAAQGTKIGSNGVKSYYRIQINRL